MKSHSIGGRKKGGNYRGLFSIGTCDHFLSVKCYCCMFNVTVVVCDFVANLSCFLQAQFSQMRPVAMAPSVAPRMQMYPPGAPGLGQQFLHGQGPPAMIPQVFICF
jgi:hypothetical protein